MNETELFNNIDTAITAAAIKAGITKDQAYTFILEFGDIISYDKTEQNNIDKTKSDLWILWGIYYETIIYDYTILYSLFFILF